MKVLLEVTTSVALAAFMAAATVPWSTPTAVRSIDDHTVAAAIALDTVE